MTREELEKEAEEKYCKGCKLRMEQCLWAWRNTNGLNEPNEKNCSCKEVPIYIKGAEFGYNKANEWHYVKDELPTNTGLYLIFYYNSFFNDKVRCIARYSPDRKEFLNLNIEDGDEVIAWCELPAPPKESE